MTNSELSKSLFGLTVSEGIHHSRETHISLKSIPMGYLVTMWTSGAHSSFKSTQHCLALWRTGDALSLKLLSRQIMTVIIFFFNAYPIIKFVSFSLGSDFLNWKRISHLIMFLQYKVHKGTSGFHPFNYMFFHTCNSEISITFYFSF